MQEDFQESRFSSQENLLIAIEETLELITRQLLQSNESFVCEQRTNFGTVILVMITNDKKFIFSFVCGEN